jgi:hypothetical protein
VSARLSPDGMYYWDGQQWVSTLSHDGRSRWNGSAWVPSGQAGPPAGYQPAPGIGRQPTSWTRPLQYAVAGWYALSALYTLTTPFWLKGPMTQAIAQSIQRQEQLQPSATPLPPGFTDMMNSFMAVGLWVSALIAVAISVLVIIGAFKRWTWMYYVVLVLLGFSTISLPLNIVSIFVGPSMSAAQGFSLPSWTYWIAVVISIPAAALFVWMVIALIKRGPWAMTRVAPPLS